MLQRRVVTEREFFVEAFLAYAVLLLEGIEPVDAEGHVRQGEGIAAVAGILVVQGVDRKVELAVPVARVRDGRGNLVLQRFVDGMGVVAVVGRAGEVDRCRETGPRTGLAVLLVGPLDAEVAGREKVRAALFTGLVVAVVEAEAAGEFVSDHVARVDVERPGAQGIDVAGHREVKVVADDEIHAHVAREETAGLFLAEGRHQQAGGAGGLFRYEAEGEHDGQRNAGDIGNRGAENGLLARFRDDLGHLELEEVMRFLEVADGVHAVGDVDGLVRQHLDVAALEQAFVLLGDHVGDAGLAALEVVAELFHLVGLAALAHFGHALPLAGQRVQGAPGIDRGRIHVILHVVGRQLEILVLDGNPAPVVDLALAVGEDLQRRVGGIGEGRTVEGTLAEQVDRVGLENRIGPVQGVAPGL